MSFKVTDRRIFTEGVAEQGAAETPASAPASPADASEPQGPQPAASAAPSTSSASEPRGRPVLPPVDFQTFVISLGSSALMHLGAIESPDTGRREPNLDLAKHTIDVLAMLEKKTQGNLTQAESHLITSLLYDLRLKYVEAARR